MSRGGNECELSRCSVKKEEELETARVGVAGLVTQPMLADSRAGARTKRGVIIKRCCSAHFHFVNCLPLGVDGQVGDKEEVREEEEEDE